MEAAGTSETSANFYQTARRNNPDVSRLQESVICILSSTPHLDLTASLFILNLLDKA
jgi:hypothetical protein